MSNDAKKLSAYIDSLNNEKKPVIRADSEELNRMFVAVRQIKSLKPPVMPDGGFSDKIVQNLTEKKKKSIKNRRQALIGGMAGIAAILVLALFIANMIRNRDIVYAMEQAYGKVKAYHGILEVIFNNEAGETHTQSLLDVWVDKKGNYYIEVLEGSYQGLKTVRKEGKVWQYSIDKTVFPVFSETYEFIFELGNEIYKLKNAESVRIIGDDSVAGRHAYIMEVTPKGGLPYKLWIDKETKTPLKKQGAMTKAIQYITVYTDIEFVDSIPEELTTIVPDAGFKEADFDTDKKEDTIDNDDPVRFTPEFKVDVDMEVEKAEQISADSGSSPWKLDPVYVAQVFVSLQISPEGIVGDYPVDYDDLVISEKYANSVKIRVNNEKTNIKTVYLERLIRQDDTGIWTVTGYDVSE
ncbi:MAG: hypothetical protein GX022_03455 [Clostridiaceae bacterium]|nr:hypothetical protein [Clostridiaceae bacterium]